MSGLHAVDTPVATRYQPPVGRWRLLVFGGLLTIAVVGAVVAATAVLWQPDNSLNPIVHAGTVRDLETGEPRYFERQGFFLVKLETGEIIALAEEDPHGNPRGESGCDIAKWSPDFVFQGRTGWFRSTCASSTFALNGQVFSGPSPRPMDRYAVTIDGDSITVDTRRGQCQQFRPSYNANDAPPGAGIIDEDCDGAIP